MKDMFDDIPLSSFREEHGDSLSMAEYEELRLMLASAKAAFADEDKDIVPRPAIHRNLSAMVAARRQKKALFALPELNLQKLLHFPIPAYQFGLAIAAVLIVALFFGRIGLGTRTHTVTVYKTDTVYEQSQKKIPAPALALDSEDQTRTHSYSGSLYADSMGINTDDGSMQGSVSLPADLHQNAPAQMAKPAATQRKIAPAVIDSPQKGNSRLEDTSRLSRQLRG